MWTGGASYEYYVGRWSRLVARQFLTWLDVPSGAMWLDVGCGTRALSQTILEIASPHVALGIDSSEGYIEFALCLATVLIGYKNFFSFNRTDKFC